MRRVPVVAGVATDGHESAQRRGAWNRVCVGASNDVRRTGHCMHHRQTHQLVFELQYYTVL